MHVRLLRGGTFAKPPRSAASARTAPVSYAFSASRMPPGAKLASRSGRAGGAAGAHGARVVVNDIGASLDGKGLDEGPAARVVAEIREAGGEAVASLDSVAAPEGAQRIVKRALDTFGRLDGIVNNAGILRDAFFHKMTEDDWDKVLKVPLYGSFNISRAAATLFKDQQAGSLVHMTSTSGLIGNKAQANYSAAKLGIVGLSKSIALDMERFGVRSNCIAPFAWSRMISSIKVDTPEQQARVARLQMTPAKVAPLAVYLLSDQAASVSGQIFSVRNNEIFLFSQPRPVRSVQRDEGWTPEQIAAHAMPALAARFHPLEVSADVFTWIRSDLRTQPEPSQQGVPHHASRSHCQSHPHARRPLRRCSERLSHRVSDLNLNIGLSRIPYRHQTAFFTHTTRKNILDHIPNSENPCYGCPT